MTEAELKAFIAAEIDRKLKPYIRELKPLVRDLAGLAAIGKNLRQEQEKGQRSRDAILLKLAEIERHLGIDPAASELDPHYRN